MTEEQKKKVAGALWAVWQKIGSDVIQVIKDCGENFIEEEEMFEACSDAHRPVTSGYLTMDEYQEFIRSPLEVQREIRDMAFKNEGGPI